MDSGGIKKIPAFLNIFIKNAGKFLNSFILSQDQEYKICRHPDAGRGPLCSIIFIFLGYNQIGLINHYTNHAILD